MRQVLLLLIWCTTTCSYGQIPEVLNQLSQISFRWSLVEAPLTNAEKISLLSKLEPGDTVEFYDPYEEGRFPLDTTGLHYLDLDRDSDLDLVYYSLSGNMGKLSAKIYLFENDLFTFLGTVTGRIINLQLYPQTRITTYIHPCCDSYTNSIRTYVINHKVECLENIAYITLKPGHFMGAPEFSGKRKKINSGALYMSPYDVKGGYFREKTRAIIDSLRRGHFVKAAQLPSNVGVTIIDKRKIDGTTWYLVLTEPILKPDQSFYEDWQTRILPKTRYLGWTK